MDSPIAEKMNGLCAVVGFGFGGKKCGCEMGWVFVGKQSSNLLDCWET